MADATMVVTELTRITGIPTWVTDTNVLPASSGTTGTFLFPNDGKTFVILFAKAAGAGEVMTFTGKNDKYGRPSADLNFNVATGLTGMVGPFSPALWNNTDGIVTFALTEKHADSRLLAVRISNTGINGV